MADAVIWAAILLTIGVNLYGLALTVRRQRQARHYVVTTVTGMPLGMFVLWGVPGEGETAPCPRCGADVFGMIATNPNPQATVHTIPCDHTLTPDQGMALRMTATEKLAP